MYLYEITRMMDEAKSPEDFERITDVLASGDISYAYPYQLKRFISRYAALVKQYVKRE